MAVQYARQRDGRGAKHRIRNLTTQETCTLTGRSITMVWSATDNVSLISSLNRPGNPEVVTTDSTESMSEWLQEFPWRIERVLIAHTLLTDCAPCQVAVSYHRYRVPEVNVM